MPAAGATRRVGLRLGAAAVGAAVLAGALVVALSGGGGGGAGQSGPVALAAATTGGEPGFKFDMTISASDGAQTTGLEASGAFDMGPPLSGSMDATVDGTPIDERIVGSDLYLQSTLTGGRWLHASLGVVPGSVGSAGSSTQLTSANPGQTLDYLRATGTVTDEGQDTIGGVATTHYHVDVDLSRYAAMLPASQQAAAEQSVQGYEQATGSSTLPMDVWIDGSNLVREIEFDLTVAGTGSVSFTMDFYDYGPQPAVSAPPPGDVIDTGTAQTPSYGSASTQPAD